MTARAFLDGLFRTAIAAAHPSSCLPPHLPPAAARRPADRAGGRQGRRLHDRGGGGRLRGHCGCAEPAHRRRRGAAGLRPADPSHPDDRGRPSDPRRRGARSRRAGARARRRRGPRTISCWCCSRAARRPTGSRRREGLSLADKQAVTRALLRSRRQHRRDQHACESISRASRAGGSRARAQPARVVTLAISDVPGDDPAVIGSGPTVPDPTTLADARAVVARYRLDLPRGRRRARSPIRRTKRRSRATPIFAATEYKLIARPADAFRAAEQRCGRPATNASCSATASRARPATSRPSMPRRRWRLQTARPPRRHPVRRRVDGDHPRPGPRRPEPGIRPGAGAGAQRRARHRGARRRHRRHRRRRGLRRTTRPAPRSTRPRSPGPASLGLDPAHFLADNDSTGFFTRLGDLVETGPTWTNVNDFRAIVVDRP